MERDLNISDVLNADEIFLTNVVMEVLPVVQVEKHIIGQGKVGPVSGRIASPLHGDDRKGMPEVRMKVKDIAPVVEQIAPLGSGPGLGQRRAARRRSGAVDHEHFADH